MYKKQITHRLQLLVVSSLPVFIEGQKVKEYDVGEEPVLRVYVRGMDGMEGVRELLGILDYIVLVYDVADQGSFQFCERFISSALEERLVHRSTRGLLVGKIGKQRVVKSEQGQKLSENIGQFMEVEGEVIDYVIRVVRKQFSCQNIRTISELNEDFYPETSAPPLPPMVEEKKPEEPEFRSVKVLLLGRAGVGKTSLGLRYTKNSFCEKYTPTIGVEVYFKQLINNGEKVKVQFWDFGNLEMWPVIFSLYCKGTNILFLLYSCLDRESFVQVDLLYHRFKDSFKQPPLPKMFLVANKSKQILADVGTEQGYLKAQQLGLQFYEVSAMKNYNVDNLVEQSVDKFLKQNVV